MTQTAVEPEVSQVPVAQSPEALDKAIAGLGEGTMTFDDLVEILAPTAEPQIVAPAKAPVTQTLNAKQQAALDRLPEVYGKIIVAERRMLRPAEIDALLYERETLDELEGLTTKRKETIRTTVAIHLDVEAEQTGAAKGKLYDTKGHLILEGVVAAADGQKAFIRGVVEKSATMDPGTLKAMDQSGELPHEAYLAVTKQERVFSQEKFMLYLREHPEMLEVFRRAIRSGSRYTQVRIGKP